MAEVKKATRKKQETKYKEYVEHFAGKEGVENEKLITIKDISNRYGISYDAARKVIQRNVQETPENRLVVKVGKRYMIRPSDFEKLIRDF